MSEQLNIPMYMCASIKLQIDVMWQAVDVPMNHYVPYNVNPKNRILWCDLSTPPGRRKQLLIGLTKGMAVKEKCVAC